MPILLKELLQIAAIFILPLIWSIYHYRKTKKNPTDSNKYFFESIPQIFPTIGILCTFFGIAYGLWNFDSSDPEKSLPELMNGLKTAFFASIGGVALLIISSRFIEYRQWQNEKDKLSSETIALNKIVVLLTEMKADASKNFTYLHENNNKANEVLSGIREDINKNAIEFNNNFILTDENNNKAKPANVFRDIYDESKQQTKALKSFSTDLANTISAGFENLMGQQNTLSSIPYLEKLQQEIADLGSKLKDPATEMTQNVVKDLEAALERMVQEFKMSVSGSAKEELETLATLLGQAGGSLTDFPKKLEEMTNNLNENFKGLQTIVQQISQQTISQSTESTESMKTLLVDLSTVFKQNIGSLQSGQAELITKQSENVRLSDRLLNAFNTSIEKMNVASNQVNETILKFSKVQSELNSAAGQLKMISENVNVSSNNFKDSQLKFAQHSNQFLDSNAKIIEEIQKTLTRSKEMAADYSQKFIIIESGLKGIFEQIQTGLHDYNKTIGGSLEKFLGDYATNLTKTTDALKGVSTMQEGLLAELSDQLDNFSTRTKIKI